MTQDVAARRPPASRCERGRMVRLTIPGSPNPIVIPFSQITRLAVAASSP